MCMVVCLCVSMLHLRVCLCMELVDGEDEANGRRFSVVRIMFRVTFCAF